MEMGNKERVKRFCRECIGGDLSVVKECTDIDCPFWGVFETKNRVKDRDIQMYCLAYCQYEDIEDCKKKDCYFWDKCFGKIKPTKKLQNALNRERFNLVETRCKAIASD